MSENKVCEVFKTSKGGIKVYINGFAYSKNRSVGNIYYWSCEKRPNKIHGCSARITTKLNKKKQHILTKGPSEHNHGPDPLRKKIADFKEKLKSNAGFGSKACNVIDNIKAHVAPELLNNLPSTEALRQLIYRRKRNLDISEEPTDLHFEINETHTEINGVNFIIKDKIYDGHKRIIIMSTLYMMDLISNCTYWLFDGSFKIVPSIFKHLYVLHGNILDDNKKTFPLLYCLSTHMDEQTYDVMFETILEYGLENNINMTPNVCIMDFEESTILSFRSKFEYVMLHGWNFCLGQQICRRVQARNYDQKYATDINFNKDVKCLLALSYLEEHEIPGHFQKLNETVVDRDCRNIMDWFAENFVGIFNKPPKYSPSFWSSHKLGEMNIPIAQNSAEAWHHKINIMIDRRRPGVYQMIKELIQDSITNRAAIESILNGAPPEKKQKYCDKDERIQRILDSKNDYSEIEILQALASNLRI